MPINIIDLGKMNYRQALEIQEQLLEKRQANEIADTLLLVEHPATLTLGTRGQHSNILASEEMLAKNGIEIFEVNRGGDVTYHGPGQLVGYPIMNLSCVDNDIKQYIWNIEETFIRLLDEEYGIAATREDKKYTGVWVSAEPAGQAGQAGQAWQGSEPKSDSSRSSFASNDRKITAIGIAVKRWVTMHGFAFNINTNLEHFKLINPCGITDKGVTSLKELTGVEQDFLALKLKVTQHFCEVFKRQMRPAKLEDLI